MWFCWGCYLRCEKKKKHKHYSSQFIALHMNQWKDNLADSNLNFILSYLLCRISVCCTDRSSKIDLRTDLHKCARTSTNLSNTNQCTWTTEISLYSDWSLQNFRQTLSCLTSANCSLMELLGGLVNLKNFLGITQVSRVSSLLVARLVAWCFTR